MDRIDESVRRIQSQQLERKTDGDSLLISLRVFSRQKHLNITRIKPSEWVVFDAAVGNLFAHPGLFQLVTDVTGPKQRH